MCEKITPVGKIFGPFFAPNRAKICQFIGFRLFSLKIFTGFTWNFIHKLIGATFFRYVKERPKRPKFVGNFGPPNESKFRFSTILSKNSALYAHWGYFQRCVQCGLQRPNFGPFWAPKEIKSLFFGHFLKKFSLVSHQYCRTRSLQVLLDVWMCHFGYQNK